MRLLRSLLPALLLAAFGIVPISAQLTGQNKSADASEAPTIYVTRSLVIETVVVKDKKGNPIDGLTAKDFTITEDGAPQSISFCEHQSLPETATPLAVTPNTSAEDIKIYNRLAAPRSPPRAPARSATKTSVCSPSTST